MCTEVRRSLALPGFRESVGSKALGRLPCSEVCTDESRVEGLATVRSQSAATSQCCLYFRWRRDAKAKRMESLYDLLALRRPEIALTAFASLSAGPSRPSGAVLDNSLSLLFGNGALLEGPDFLFVQSEWKRIPGCQTLAACPFKCDLLVKDCSPSCADVARHSNLTEKVQLG